MPPTTQINIRRDTAANFTSANPTLALGEIAYETDTRNIKVGDGATAWTALGYINPYRGGTAAAPTSNTVLGSGAGAAMQSTADFNTLIGESAGAGITSGDSNTVVGRLAGGVTTGNDNTAIGRSALVSIGTGSSCVAVGRSAAALNTASNITAVGANALDANTTGTNNTAVGKDALGANTTGSNNIAVGGACLDVNTTGQFNVAVGYDALGECVSGSTNTAIGQGALGACTGSQSTGCGTNTGLFVTTGNGVFVGHNAGLFFGSGSTASDYLTSADESVFLGRNTRPAANSQTNQIVIGNSAIGKGSNTTTIGNSSTTATHLKGNIFASTDGANITRVIQSSASADGTTSRASVSAVASPGYTTGIVTCANGYTTIAGAPSETSQSGVVFSNAPTGLRLHSYNNALGFWVGNPGARRAYISSSGDVGIDNGNLVIGTSGKGIDFSATANSGGTMTSELLSDYEEGTWTPTYIPSSGSFATMTMDVVSATYTKIGRQVTVRAWIRTDNVDITGGTGILSISGLPFTTATGDAGRTSGYVGAATAWAANGFPFAVNSNQGATTMNIFKRAAADGVVANATPADLITGAVADQNRLEFVCTYFT